MADFSRRATILLGPAASGKTQRLVELLVGKAPSIEPRWAILPDRTQVASFRRRIAAAGGALGVSVGTFGDLFQEILARAGRPVAVTPEAARQRLLRLALRHLEGDGRLAYYQPIVRTPGFLEVMAEAIVELKRARVEPEAVAELADTLEAAPLAELAHIYTEYQSRLADIAWTDREGLNQLAIQALTERPGLLADMPLIAIDGFDSFEAAQLGALTALSGSVQQLIVTLPGNRSMERAAFRRFAIALDDLQRALPQAELIELTPAGVPGRWRPQPSRAGQPEMSPGEPTPPGSGPPTGRLEARAATMRPPALDQLEAALFDPQAEPIDPGQAIEMIEARSPADESREALRWIKARLVRDGAAMEDCAVILPDAERYGPPLRRASAEFGVQLQFTHGDPLIRAPAVAALLDLLDLSRSNWPRRLVLQAIRSPYFELSQWGFVPGDALALDAASQAGQVVRGLDQWEQALDQLVEMQAAQPELLDEEFPAFAPPTGESAIRLRGAIAKLAKRLAPSGTRSTAGWVGWLEDLLEALGFPERVSLEGPPGDQDSGQRGDPAFEGLRETLRALVLGELVAGDQPLQFGEFLDELRSALEAAAYRERIASGPAVTVMNLLEARGGRYRSVAVLGLSEGLLPAVEREDPFLNEDIRQSLGLQPRLGREQPGLFYQAVTRADVRMLLTRPYLADDGEAWEPSPFWREFERLLGQPARRIRPEDPRPLQEAGSPGELLFWGVRRGGMPASLLAPQRQRWAELQHGREVLAARSARQPQGSFEGGLADSSATLAERFGSQHLWSPSRLETYGTCPYMFFTAHVLGLEARQPPEPGLDAAQLGSILHEILESAFRAAPQPIDPDSVLEALEQVIDPILDQAPARHGFRPTPLWEIERAQYADALRETIRALAEEGQDWTPIGLELAFGMREQPALELDLPQGAVQVRGLIDRLDRRSDGSLRVIDYKTGRSHLGVTELHRGRRIQLPLYALAAQEALGLGQVVDGFYWAILAAKSGSLHLQNYQPAVEDAPTVSGFGPPAAYAVARAHVSHTVDGVRAGNFPPIPPPGGCPEYCPAAAWCWRYQPVGWG